MILGVKSTFKGNNTPTQTQVLHKAGWNVPCWVHMESPKTFSTLNV